MNATSAPDHHAERLRAVTSPHGYLALVGYQSICDSVRLDDMPISARPDGDGREGVWIEALDDGVTLDGRPVPPGQEVFVARLRPDGTPLLRWHRRTADVFSLDGTDYELRLYSADSQSLSNFSHIECYPHNPAAVMAGRFVRSDQVSQVAWDFSRSADSGHTKKVPGVIHLEIEGQACELVAFLDGPALVLVFSDGTTGKESYAPGRFLRMDCPADGEALIVDFNRAIVPPCGFSDFYSCPIPPQQNHIEAPIRAGEMRVHWHRPRY